MKTIIFDIDGTITNMWPIEKCVLLFMTDNNYTNKIEELKRAGVSDTYDIFSKISKSRITKQKFLKLYNRKFFDLLNSNRLPIPEKYPLVAWISTNKEKYRFVFATGAQELEVQYTLKNLGIIECFDLDNSINKSNCRFSKQTGIPFKIIKSKVGNCLLITDSKSDIKGARVANIPSILIRPKQNSFKLSFK
ncbi:MAG: HAD hydrolase-like protein [Patescibacteria group bacterium]